jgi:hypothetical protein
MIRKMLWRAVARIVTAPAVAEWLIRRAQRTPYTHIHGPDGSLYMGRWWLFNPYPPNSDGGGSRRGWRGRLPSVRIHHITRPDSDRHMHDHPWDARTVILRGGYEEERVCAYTAGGELRMSAEGKVRHVFWRRPGYTGTLRFGEFHRISDIPEGGAWTLFITSPKRGSWGFFVDGRKVPWREYFGVQS